jgi:hypothetical protein
MCKYLRNGGRLLHDAFGASGESRAMLGIG